MKPPTLTDPHGIIHLVRHDGAANIRVKCYGGWIAWGDQELRYVAPTCLWCTVSSMP